MKTLSVVLLCLSTITLAAQNGTQGKTVVKKFIAPSIQNNRGGEDPMRRLTVYLPPGYDNSKQRYPVVYFLHGFGVNDSLDIAFLEYDKLLNVAMQSKFVKPMILVFPNSFTRYGGSFYTNSSLTGKWADFISKDIVEYVDKHFRTIPERNSRGIAGHSMGGYGTIKLAMEYPEVFGAAYALSPAVLSWLNEFNLDNKIYQILDTVKNEITVSNILKKPLFTRTDIEFSIMVSVSLARAFSPNENKPPLFANLPVRFVDNKAVQNSEVVKRWEANFPMTMVENHVEALRSLNALKIDWGRDDEFKDIPITCLQFSKKLEVNTVKHYAEEYIGDHTSGLGEKDGRFYSEMLPFFDTYLTFDKK